MEAVIASPHGKCVILCVQDPITSSFAFLPEYLSGGSYKIYCPQSHHTGGHVTRYIGQSESSYRFSQDLEGQGFPSSQVLPLGEYNLGFLGIMKSVMREQG